MAELYMVFDVESAGLHGEGFAVGYVVIDSAGHEKTAGRFCCDRGFARGTKEGHAWVAANIPPLTKTHARPKEVREAFWAVWMEWKSKGAMLAADCAWPVEARFLAACVDDARPVVRGVDSMAEGPRDWQGPYPLIDVASVRLTVGLDPLATEERRPDELPPHDPLADARQSARLLIEALQSVPPL